jgi:alcohol dehydrogenase (cytochrome c)
MGATNWQPPSYSPQSELFYFNGTEGYGVAYLYDTSEHPEGYGGGGGGGAFDSRSTLFAMDIRTGAVKWKHSHPTGRGNVGGGILTTAGKLLFAGDSGSLVAFDPPTGKLLWHQQLMQPLSNGPSSYMLDGKQYIVVGAGDCLYAFTLAGKK